MESENKNVVDKEKKEKRTKDPLKSNIKNPLTSRKNENNDGSKKISNQTSSNSRIKKTTVSVSSSESKYTPRTSTTQEKKENSRKRVEDVKVKPSPRRESSKIVNPKDLISKKLENPNNKVKLLHSDSVRSKTLEKVSKLTKTDKISDHVLKKSDILSNKKSSEPMKALANTPRKSSNSLVISKNANVYSTNSPRGKIVNKNEKHTKETSSKLLVTNVTVNSPKRKPKAQAGNSASVFIRPSYEIPIENIHHEVDRVISQDEDLSIDEVLDESRKHKRYRTRTLAPNEVKILNRDESDENIGEEMKSLVKTIKRADGPPPAKPQAFYIPLNPLNEDKHQNEGVSKVVASNQSEMQSPSNSNPESMSYDEDFDSYESDFESFDSSSNTEIEHSNSNSASNEGFDSNTEHSDEDINNDEIKKHLHNDEEMDLDSGNYDLKEIKVSQTQNSKLDNIVETALEMTEIPYAFEKSVLDNSEKQIFYTDEGFEENSGGFSTASTSGHNKTEEIFDPFTNDSLLRNKHKKQKISYYRQRALDLCSLITLDEIKYSLFEINPIPYDVFIQIFGKSNFVQSHTQTNDDYIDEIIQTDQTFISTKWNQFPVNFSNYEVILTNVDKKNKKKSLCINLYEKDDSTTKDFKTEMKYLRNPLEIYCKQRIGCNTEISQINEYLSNKLYSDHKIHTKLYNFMQKVGKFMCEYLDSGSSAVKKVKSSESKMRLSTGYVTPLQEVSKLAYLIRRPPVLVSFSASNINCFLTVHKQVSVKEINKSSLSVEDIIYSRTLICIWHFIKNIPTNPIKILISVNDISSCRLLGSTSDLVVAGLCDGTICAWDLKEHDMWHNLIRKSIEDLQKIQDDKSSTTESKSIASEVDNLILRCCSYNSCNVNFNSDERSEWWGPVSDVLFYESSKQSNNLQSNMKVKNYDQLCTLQEYGLLTVWIVINQNSVFVNDLKDNSNYTNSLTQTYWSRLTLHKSLIINIKETFASALNVNMIENTTIFQKKTSGDYRDFPLTDVQRRNSIKRAALMTTNQEDKVSDMFSREDSAIHTDDKIIKDSSMKRVLTENDTDFNISDLEKQIAGLYYLDDKNIQMRTRKNPEKVWSGCSWQNAIKCFTVKYIKNIINDGHFLVSCSAGKIANYSQRGYLKDPHVFFCTDHTSAVKVIEVCPHNLPYFFVGCDDSIHLYSLYHNKPLKNFINEITLSELNIGSTILAQNDIQQDIVQVQWSKVRPCLFFTLSSRGRLAVWDLMKSDLIPVMFEELGEDEKRRKVTMMELEMRSDSEGVGKYEYMALTRSSGDIEIHTLHEDLYNNSLHMSAREERVVLEKYFNLL